MENKSATQFHDHEHVKDAETSRNHNKEIRRDDPLGMVVEEGQPTLSWIWGSYRSKCAQVLLDSTRRNPNTEFQLQLVSDAFLSPCRILGRHLSDQLPQVLGKCGLPVGLDFQRQNSRNPLRCQPMSVSGLTLA